MPRPLGAEEFGILQQHSNAGDRIAYYEQLAEWGYVYAGLALGVVNNDTVAGATANIYFLNEAAEEGIPISNNQLATISLNLMRADFAARQNFVGSANGEELPVDVIQRYHEVAFGLEGVSANAWTPNFALENLDTVAQREALWDALLNQGIPTFSPLAAAIEDLNTFEANEYRGDVISSGAAALLSESNDFGDFSASIGNGGFAIGGNAEDNSELTGSAGNDVLMGFDGNDAIDAGIGNDIIYGGLDDDTLSAMMAMTLFSGAMEMMSFLVTKVPMSYMMAAGSKAYLAKSGTFSIQTQPTSSTVAKAMMLLPSQMILKKMSSS